MRAALALLERELIETPALAIAVLNELPQYRTILAGYLARFVQKYDAKCPLRFVPARDSRFVRARAALSLMDGTPPAFSSGLAAFGCRSRRDHLAHRRGVARADPVGRPAAPYAAREPVRSAALICR